MRSLFVVGPVLSWRERYVQNYVFAFCASGWGRVLFKNFWAGKVCFCVFVFPENKPVDITRPCGCPPTLTPLRVSCRHARRRRGGDPSLSKPESYLQRRRGRREQERWQPRCCLLGNGCSGGTRRSLQRGWQR
jgi:hypothetical protein